MSNKDIHTVVSSSGSEMEGGSVGDRQYDNSKLRRLDSLSFYEQVNSPTAIISSIYKDLNWILTRDFIVSAILFYFGAYSWKAYIAEHGWLRIRPIPYQVTQAGDVLLDLTLTNDLVEKPDQIFPSYKLWFIALKLPLIIIITIGAIFPLVISNIPKNNPLVNIHHGTCTILVAIGLSEFVCNTAKVYVGRLRPNFYAMCGFDKETLECTADSHMQAESRMSFPSGHSSVSFTGLVCVTLFLLGRVGLNRNVGTISSARGKILLLVSCMPLLLAFYCATSRLADNWHHPSDILAGTALGTICGFISYHMWFPHIFHMHAGVPLAAIKSAEEGSDYTLVEKSLSLPVYNV